MSVVGIDFGNENCYISVARGGGIESIANDYSMRGTPSYVAFGENQRLMGVAAKSQHLTNLKKTFFGFKPLIGRKFKDPVVKRELHRIPYPVSEDPRTGEVLVHVQFMGKENAFTPKQVTAMLFTKLKDIAEQSLSTKVKDVVISVPCYYSDAERRCILDAAVMSDLNVLKLMNDTTATALAYGIYKQDLPPPEEKARNVIFVDVGHRGAQAVACSFNKGKLSMLCCTFDSDFGGRNLDENICKYFAEIFKKNYKIDVYSSPKAILKLMTEAEKLKKQMSANTNKLPLNIECFMEDKDVKGHIDRTAFEEISAKEIDRIEKVLEECLTLSKWKKDDIYSVEIVGGSTRIPFIKNAIERIFGKTPNTTLNADEAVSRGCALQCAILSPTFKVREFSVTDVQPYPIRLKWKAEQEAGCMVVFNKFDAFPFSRMLTFYRSSNFELEVEYDEKGIVMDPHIGKFEVLEIKPSPEGGNTKVKVKARIDINGIFTIVSATMSENHEIEEEVPMVVEEEKKPATDEGSSGQTEASESSKNLDDSEQQSNEPEKKENKKEETPPQPKMEKQKRIVKKTINLPVCSRVVGSLSSERLSNAVSVERAMLNQDRMEAERLTCKNAVEEYVYDIRSKINGEYYEFMSDEDRNKFSIELEDSENWLYEEGENVGKKVYVEKIKTLQKTGESVKNRKTEYDGRSVAYVTLGNTLQLASKVVNAFRAGDERYVHLDAAEVEKVVKLVDEKTVWMNSNIQKLSALDKATDPPISVSQFYEETKAFEAIANPILNKSKPKVEPPPKTEEETKNNETKPEDTNGDVTKDPQVPVEEMEVD